ncbi:MAG: hypothetical protein M3N16_02350 [Actinomycetota bacterium]|nr:hypothetical protein [Actinomycetota bacterium]
MTLLAVTTGEAILALIGNAVLLVVALIVVALFNRTVRPALSIDGYADDILQGGLGINRNLDALEELQRTQELATRIATLADRYVRSRGA